MAIVAPFRAIRYNPARVGRLEEVVTPPYDVIDERAQAAFLARNPYNMIQLDLSKQICRPDEDTCADRYGQAARLFQQWLEEGVLQEDESPALYLYWIDYTHPSGRRLTRKGFISLVRLEDFSTGVVKPHEKTFAAVTDDRLRLMEATGAQFSQIFSLYSDPEAVVMTALEKGRADAPVCEVVDQDGCRHRLWPVDDPAVIEAVREAMGGTALYIADGHHRYTTALRLRDRERERRGGELPADDPYNQIAMYLCPMEDKGLSVLPTHRLVRLPSALGDAGALLDRLRACFTVQELSEGSRESLVAEALARLDEHRQAPAVFGLYHAGEDRCFLLFLQADCAEWKAVDQPAPLRGLDVVVLSDLVLERLLGLSHERCETQELIEYFSDAGDALDLAVKEAGSGEGVEPVVFLMRPTGVEQVRRIADEGLYMPHKSTYFYPKILTGLVIRRLR